MIFSEVRAMNEKRDYINTEHCGEEIQDDVLALADGTLKDRKRHDEIVRHLVGCVSCRYLFEDYVEIHEELFLEELPAEKKSPWLEIVISLAEKGVRAIESSLQIAVPGAEVLGGMESDVLEYEFAASSGEGKINIARAGEKLDVEVSLQNGPKRVYLLSEGDVKISAAEEGRAEFRNISGDMLIFTVDFREFIKISIER